MNERNALSTAFADMGGAHGVFTSKANDYASARPGYPAALYAHLEKVVAIDAPLCVADIGAGTGLFAQGWLARGHRVVAVEPNDAMRAVAEAQFGAHPRYRSTSGAAEATGLADTSVDLVTAAQAFHWFDIEAFRRECLRILRPHGLVVLVWNDRGADALNNALTDLFVAFGGAQRAAMAASNVKDENISQFFGVGTVQEWSTTHTQVLDAAGLAALAFSRSFMPAADSAQGIKAIRALKQMMDAHGANGQVRVDYLTRAFVGRPA